MSLCSWSSRPLVHRFSTDPRFDESRVRLLWTGECPARVRILALDLDPFATESTKGRSQQGFVRRRPVDSLAASHPPNKVSTCKILPHDIASKRELYPGITWAGAPCKEKRGLQGGENLDRSFVAQTTKTKDGEDP